MGDCPIARSAGVSRQGREAHSSAATTFGRASPSAVAEQANSALEPTALRAAAQRPESLTGEAFRPRGTTMSLTMTKEAREAFLADVHVAVISVAEDGHGPIVVPIWYSYQPGGEVRIITGRTSRKGKLLERAGRFSLCVQTE